MKNYEVTFIVDPVLSGDEIKSTAKAYTSLLENEGCKITHHNEMGLQQLAYSINNRQSGFYFCTEFSVETGEVIPKLELAMRRDERVMRFLSIKLDKYGVKYNEDKRNGLIGTIEKKKVEEDEGKDSKSSMSNSKSKPSTQATKKSDVAVKTEAKEEVKAEEKATVETKVEETATAIVESKVEEVKVEEKKVIEETKEQKSTSSEDDLTKIEGIGPKIASLLIGAGIVSFADLASTDVDRLKSILADAGSRYSMHNPTTWPKQSEMAADGKWDELKKWQDELDGGRPESKNEEE